MDAWLKIKQESAGWPRWCVTPEDKARYVEQYREREGIQLDSSLIEKNPGRKQVAKLMLNSFWGKFGERANKPKTEQIQNPVDLYNILHDPAVELSTLRVCNDDVLEAVYSQTQENVVPSVKTNIFIAAFTTCHARLKLYSYLNRLQKQVLYYDTDSVIYPCLPDQPRIPPGDFLGDMTDELEGITLWNLSRGVPKIMAIKPQGVNSNVR